MNREARRRQQFPPLLRSGRALAFAMEYGRVRGPAHAPVADWHEGAALYRRTAIARTMSQKAAIAARDFRRDVFRQLSGGNWSQRVRAIRRALKRQWRGR